LAERIISNKERLFNKVFLNNWKQGTSFYPFSSKHLLEAWFRKSKWADFQLVRIIGSTYCTEIKGTSARSEIIP